MRRAPAGKRPVVLVFFHRETAQLGKSTHGELTVLCCEYKGVQQVRGPQGPGLYVAHVVVASWVARAAREQTRPLATSAHLDDERPVSRYNAACCAAVNSSIPHDALGRRVDECHLGVPLEGEHGLEEQVEVSPVLT